MRRDDRDVISGKTLGRGGLIATVLLLTALTALPARADPPGRAGRLTELDGAVSFHMDDQADWSPAVGNYPVTSGTSVWTEPEARASVQIGAAAIRMAGATELDVTTLDDQRFQAQLAQGIVDFRIRRLDPDQSWEIATARGTVRVTAPGRYRVEAGAPGPNGAPTVVAVLDGAAIITTPQTSLSLAPRESAILSGDAPVAVAVQPAQPADIDRYAIARDTAASEATSVRYLSPEVTGAEDLDRYGAWEDTPDYGRLWIPRAVPVDWAPYRYGHWGYVAPWGWTWIDDSPWGFAPFHYGRWVHRDRGWGWAPGAIVEHPVYAPALVAFIGGPPAPPPFGGVRVGVSIGFGVAIGGIAAAVGWVPLGWHEAYQPPYAASPTYVRNVNVSHVTNVTNIRNVTNVTNTSNVTNVTVNKTVVNYVNQTAATVVPAQAMTNSRPIQAAAVAVPRATLAQAPVAATPPVAPTAATIGAGATSVKPPFVGAPAATSPAATSPAAATAPRAPGPRFTPSPAALAQSRVVPAATPAVASTPPAVAAATPAAVATPAAQPTPPGARTANARLAGVAPKPAPQVAPPVPQAVAKPAVAAVTPAPVANPVAPAKPPVPPAVAGKPVTPPAVATPAPVARPVPPVKPRPPATPPTPSPLPAPTATAQHPAAAPQPHMPGRRIEPPQPRPNPPASSAPPPAQHPPRKKLPGDPT